MTVKRPSVQLYFDYISSNAYLAWIKLPEIAARTLLLVGTGDRMIAPDSMSPFQEKIPNCRRVFIYGAAHELPISAGAGWVDLVSDFIARGEASVVNAGSRGMAP